MGTRKSHKYNFRKLYHQIKKNENCIKFLKKKNIIAPKMHFLKRYRSEILLDRISGQAGSFYLTQEFYNMPTNAISLVNVILECETESGIPIDGFQDYANLEQSFQQTLSYYWEEIAENDYILHINAHASFSEKETTATGWFMAERPFYLNLYLVFINNQTAYEIQKQKI